MAQQAQTGTSIALAQQRPHLNGQTFVAATSTLGKPSIWRNSAHTGTTKHPVQQCPPWGVQSHDTATVPQGHPYQDNVRTVRTNTAGTSPTMLGHQAMDTTTLTLEAPTVWANNARTVTANHVPQRQTQTNNCFAQQHAHQGCKQFVPTTTKHEPPNIRRSSIHSWQADLGFRRLRVLSRHLCFT